MPEAAQPQCIGDSASAMALLHPKTSRQSSEALARNNSMGKKMLTKMKAVTVTKQNVLVNANNFLCRQQQKTGSLWLYLGRLKGTAKHCNFTLPMDKTSYMDKMVMNTLVQRLEDTAKAKDIMKSYATNNNP